MHNEKWKGTAYRKEGAVVKSWLHYRSLLDDLLQRVIDHILSTFMAQTPDHKSFTSSTTLRLCQAWKRLPHKGPHSSFPSPCDWNVMWKQAFVELNTGSKTQIALGGSFVASKSFNRPHNLDTLLTCPDYDESMGAGKPQHGQPSTCLPKFLTCFPFNVSKASLAYSCKR